MAKPSPMQAIRVWGERHTGFPHTHMIRDDTTVMPRERWDELAIQIAPGRVPMHEDYGFSLALIDIVHLCPIADVIVRCKGPGACPRLVFDLDHGALRR